ncbi:conserved hypothetical protein [Sphingomonas sp. 8AM]|nr:conserved hypothetical protein [Sphingomonas sp. 8AM]
MELASNNARVLTARADALIGDGSSSSGWRRAAAYARRALLRDPLSASAAATLGFEAGLRGDDAAAHRAFGYSGTLSRREFKTHLWANEYAVSRGDIHEALHQYDLALRTSRLAPDVLFPVLANAIADEPIRKELIPKLRAGREWGPAFLNFAAISAPNHRAVAILFRDLTSRGVKLPAGAEASLLGALVHDRDFATARIYLRATGNASDVTRYPRFAGNPAVPSPFDWNPQNDVGLSSSIQSSREGGLLVFSAVTGMGGGVVRQLHLLPPGRYTIFSRLTSLTPAQSVPAWSVQCADGAEIARFRLKLVTPDASPTAEGTFQVDPGCTAQWLSLIVPAGETAGGLMGEVDFATIRRVSGRPQ